MNILVIVEGQNDEIDILDYALKQYNFEVIAKKEKLTKNKIFNKIEFSNINGTNIFVVQGPQNRISKIIKEFDENELIFRYFFDSNQKFNAIFFVYDADHTSKEEMNEAFEKFKDETTTGIILLNVPCLEVISDEELKLFEGKHFKEYKRILNTYHSIKQGLKAVDYIKQNFNSLLLKWLEINCEEFKKENFEYDNFMDHPALIKKLDEKYNLREKVDSNNLSKIRYYATALYVLIGYAAKLNKFENNITYLKGYLEGIENKNEQKLKEYKEAIINSKTLLEHDFMLNICNDRLVFNKVIYELEREGRITKKSKNKAREIIYS